MVRYPVVLQPDDNGTVMVTFPDFPEALTFGEDEATALAHASDALATIVDGYIRARRPLPTASATTELVVELSPLMSAKVELYNAMQTLGVSKSALGRRLNWHAPQIDRLLNLTHSSHIDQLDAAVKALGGKLNVYIDGISVTRPRLVFGAKGQRLAIAAAVTSPTERNKRVVSKGSGGNAGGKRSRASKKR
jgi:antitoxin HicB